MLKQTIIYVERCDVLVRLFGSIFLLRSFNFRLLYLLIYFVLLYKTVK